MYKPTHNRPTHQPRVLLVGNPFVVEFHEAFRTVERCAYVELCADPKNASLYRGEWDVVLLLCPSPLSFKEEAEWLASLHANAKLVQLLGVWCEGEERTGQVVEGYQRVFWHQFAVWWNQTFGPSYQANLKPLVDARDQETRLAIESVLADQELAAVYEPQQIGIWVGSQLNGTESDRLWRFCQQMRRQKTPIIALLDFPRPETVRAALEIGAHTVLGKPIDLDLLKTAATRLVGKRANRSTRAARLLKAA